MTTTRKSLLLSVGFTVAIAGAATASERSRGTGGIIGTEEGVATTATVTNARMVSKGLATATVNGQHVTARADGAVTLDDVVKDYGSVDRAMFEHSVQNVRSGRDTNGNLLFANGATGYFADLMGSDKEKPPARTVEEFQATTPWGERTVDGVTIIAFANGVVLNDSTINQTEPAWMAHREQVANRLDDNGVRVYADGAVFIEPAAKPKDGQ